MKNNIKIFAAGLLLAGGTAVLGMGTAHADTTCDDFGGDFSCSTYDSDDGGSYSSSTDCYSDGDCYSSSHSDFDGGSIDTTCDDGDCSSTSDFDFGN